MCSTMSVKCRYVFNEVGLVSGLFCRSRVSIATCPEWSAYCRDLFGEVVLESVHVRRCRLIVGTCSVRSA